MRKAFVKFKCFIGMLHAHNRFKNLQVLFYVFKGCVCFLKMLKCHLLLFISASSLLDSIDTKADPCNNFFQFACGRWRKKQVIPEEMSITSVFYHVEDSVNIILKCKYMYQLSLVFTFKKMKQVHVISIMFFKKYIRRQNSSSYSV